MIKRGDNFMKKKIICTLMAITLSFPMTTTVHAEDSFEGWDDESKEDAWSVLGITDWTEIQEQLILDDSAKQSAEAVGISSKTSVLEDIVTSVLEDSSIETKYVKSSYVPLMLAMIEVLSSGSPNEDDPCNILKYFDSKITNMTAEKSIRLLFNRFALCETAYNENHQPESSIYSNDRALQAVIEGIMLTNGYPASTETYDQFSAQKYYNNNKHIFEERGVVPSTTFASDVSGFYQTSTYTGGGKYSGSVTGSMRDLVDIATNNAGTYPCTAGMCAAWVTGVYEAAGASVVPYGNAIDMWINYCGTGSTSMNNIPPGAIVCGSGSGSDGAAYGHVGVYLGNGLVANNLGYHSVQSLGDWCSWQTAICQGHTGWIGWGFPGGVPA